MGRSDSFRCSYTKRRRHGPRIPVIEDSVQVLRSARVLSVSLHRTGMGMGVAAVVLSLALTGCIGRRRGPASVIDMSDTSTAGQLIAGFYGVEGKKWRWTAGQFSVVLQP